MAFRQQHQITLFLCSGLGALAQVLALNPDLVGVEPPLGSAWSGVLKVPWSCRYAASCRVLVVQLCGYRSKATLVAVAQAQADVVAQPQFSGLTARPR